MLLVVSKGGELGDSGLFLLSKPVEVPLLLLLALIPELLFDLLPFLNRLMPAEILGSFYTGLFLLLSLYLLHLGELLDYFLLLFPLGLFLLKSLLLGLRRLAVEL